MQIKRKESPVVHQKKQSSEQQYKPGGNLSSAQKALYKPVWDSVMEFGKFKQRTLQYVYDNERWWYDWAYSNGVLFERGHMVLKESAMRPQTDKPKWNQFVSSDGTVWCGIRITDTKTTPADESWYT